MSLLKILYIEPEKQQQVWIQSKQRNRPLRVALQKYYIFFNYCELRTLYYINMISDLTMTQMDSNKIRVASESCLTSTDFTVICQSMLGHRAVTFNED